MQYSKYILLLLATAFFAGCSVDPLMLSGKTISVDEYDLGNPTVIESEMDTAFTIDESLIHLFPLTSDNNGDQATIWAVYIGDTNRINTDTIFFYCHGNSPSMNSYSERFRIYANVGHQHRFGFFAMDYRGFGASEGTTNAENWVADMNACLDWLNERGASGDRLVAVGNSLGGAPSTIACTYSNSIIPSKLIHTAPFPGGDAPAQSVSGLSLSSSFFLDMGTINPMEEIKSYNGMYMWSHCTDDQTVDISFGQVLYDNHNGPYKESHILEGCGHYPIGGFGDTEVESARAYQQKLLEFVTR